MAVSTEKSGQHSNLCKCYESERVIGRHYLFFSHLIPNNVMKPLTLKGFSESERNGEKFTGKKCNKKKAIQKKKTDYNV